MKFKLYSKYNPAGDQIKAIKEITNAIKIKKLKNQTLLGVTGSGKTFTMANIIEQVQKPALILSHNKTLTAQLYSEFKNFFPNNAVEYFVSYYDYYQPEAYIPSKDAYIEKDSSINDEIDRLRLSATKSILERKDVIIVSSVSCIYGLGSPQDYKDFVIQLEENTEINRKKLFKDLVEMQYTRNDYDFTRSTFRVHGDIIDIHPAYTNTNIRIEMFGDEIENIALTESISQKKIKELPQITIYPAKHFVTSKKKRDNAIIKIKEELNERIKELKSENKELEAHRLFSKTMYDIEMIKEIGYCNGIENYSRHLSQRKKGDPPETLIDYFPKDDFLLFIDESHVTISQVKAMYNGDQSRKQTLVDFGFRLPSALDNRPLKIEEFKKRIPQCIYVSATPGEEEIKLSQQITEQIIRPTGLVDPSIEVRKTENQIDDIISEINNRTIINERTIITTLTKKMSEDLSKYLEDKGIKVKYLHSEIKTLERLEILTQLRKGEFNCIVGVNLLREGIDLPEVSLVIILDADKIGFLRSSQALIQTIGRAARNINGHVIMYANKTSIAMKQAILETQRRRKLQINYNQKHKIKPKTILKNITEIIKRNITKDSKNEKPKKLIDSETNIKKLTIQMKKYAKNLDFEKAMEIKKEIQKIIGKN